MSKNASLLGAHLSDGTVRILSRRMQQRTLSADQAILGPGHSTNILYFVLEGGLDIELEENGGHVRVGHIGPGTWVGEAAFLDGGEPTATVLATEPSTVLALHRADFDRMCEEEPRAAADLVRWLLEILAHRVHASSSGLIQNISEGAYDLTHPVEEEGPFRRLLARLTGAQHE